MAQARHLWLLIALAASGLWGQEAVLSHMEVHQAPDQDGVYYVGPEVSEPVLVSTVSVPYPRTPYTKGIQGMTVMAMVINAKGIPEHIQVVHKHGDAFDRASVAGVMQSRFQPGTLAGKPVPVWIDVRVVFHGDYSEAVPQILITERDLPVPDASQFEDKRQKPLPYTAPIPIHTVDADFADPFSQRPYVQVAVVTVLVIEKGDPQAVRIMRGLGFGLDEKAVAAVWHYRFLPAMNHGKPISARRNVMVSFAKF